MDNTAQWPQGIGVVKVPMEGSRAIIDHQRRPRPQKEQALNCPRCNSTNTKFCYYNNYSLTQPRYFCKTCRRYWTEGGSLRNVPVGGGSRKHKRSTPSSSDSSKKLPHDLTLPTFSQNPKLIHEGQDLNLTYPPSAIDNYKNTHSSTTTTTPHISAMELLKTGIASSGLSPFLTYSSSGFGLQDQFKPSLNFSLDGGFDQIGYGIGSLQGAVQESSTNARLFFPFEESKQPQSTAEFEQNRGQGGEPSGGGYWSGMLGGGSW